MKGIKPYQHKVKYYECDGMAITHHSNYVRFMEEARIDWLDQLGYGFEKMEADGITSPVINISCTYKSPTRFQDIIDIEVTVVHVTELKLTFSYTMKVGDTIVCKGESTHCFIEKGTPINLARRYPELAQRLKELA